MTKINFFEKLQEIEEDYAIKINDYNGYVYNIEDITIGKDDKLNKNIIIIP